MNDVTTDTAIDKDRALGGIAGVAPTGSETPETPHVREGADAETHTRLKEDPSDPDAKLDVELDESFPSSDAPSTSRPGSSDPAPSSGYDEDAEKARSKGA